MPNTREKLVELLHKSAEYAMDFCIDNNCEDCPGRKYGLGCRDWIAADNLIANGIGFVTDNNGSKWISVKDGLPATIPCGAGTEYSEAVNVLTDGRKVLTAIWNGLHWICDAEFWDAEFEEITHWTPVLLPLPQPPKGE